MQRCGGFVARVYAGNLRKECDRVRGEDGWGMKEEGR